MKTMFRTKFNKIESFKVIKTSDKSVWYVDENGREGRELFFTDWRTWHHTEEEAKEHLIDKAETKVRRCENSLINEKNNLTKLLESLK